MSRWLVRRREQGPEQQVVAPAFILYGNRLLQVVNGAADQKRVARRHAPAGRAERTAPELYTVRSSGERHMKAIVDQDAHGCSADGVTRGAREVDQRAIRQVRFADLNQIDAHVGCGVYEGQCADDIAVSVGDDTDDRSLHGRGSQAAIRDCGFKDS